MTVKNKSDEIVVTKVGGSNFVKYKPIISLDQRFVICPCLTSIKIFSVETGQCYQLLKGHLKEVTSVAHHPKIKIQILSCSLDKTVKRWDYEDGVLLFTYKFETPLYQIGTSKAFEKNAFLLTYINDGADCQIKSFDLEAKSSEEEVTILKHVSPKLRIKRPLVSFGERFFVIASSHYFYFIEIGKEKYKYKLPKDLPKITSVSCHPTQDRCLLGHISGQITSWFALTNSNVASHNCIHWHSREVLALEWSSVGSSFFSGGHEGVMVQWSNEKPFFIPRINEIRHITVASDNTIRAVAHADNSIKIITSYNTIKQVIEGFTATSTDLPCGIKYDPVSNSFVTNGKRGHLLFYDPRNDVQLLNLDIVNKNFTSSTDARKILSTIQITQLAFVKTQQNKVFMATIEFNPIKKRDQKLKFWFFDETSKQWTLDTLISSPHNNQDILSICFHPNEELCITASEDGFAKVWINSEGWCCVGAISHKKYPCAAIHFSQDGSLVGLAFKEEVCLRDSTSFDHQVSRTLFHPSSVLDLKFGRGKCDRYLVTCTTSAYHCWDVITGHMMWNMELASPPKLLLCDDISDNMAIFDEKNRMKIFKPDTCTCLFEQQLDFSVASASFYPELNEEVDWMRASQLYIASKDMIVHKICTQHQAQCFNESKSVVKIAMDADELKTPMSLLLNPPKPVEEDFTLSKIPRRRTVEETVRAILECPSHVLPPIKTLADKFITSLLMDQVSELNDAESEQEEEEDMIVDAVCPDEEVEFEIGKNMRKLKESSFEFVKSFYSQ